MQARQSSQPLYDQTNHHGQPLYDQTNHHRKEAKYGVNNCSPCAADAIPSSKDANIPGRFVFPVILCVVVSCPLIQ